MFSLREAALAVEHVCKRGLKSALKPWLYSAPRINSSVQQPSRLYNSSGTTYGPARCPRDSLAPSGKHEEAALFQADANGNQSATQPTRRVGGRGGRSVATTSFSGGSDGVPGDWSHRAVFRGTELGGGTAQTAPAAAWLQKREDVRNTFLCCRGC